MPQVTNPRPQVKTANRQVTTQVITLMLNARARKNSNDNPNEKCQNPDDTNHSESNPKIISPMPQSTSPSPTSQRNDFKSQPRPRPQLTAPAPSHSPGSKSEPPRNQVTPPSLFIPAENVWWGVFVKLFIQPVLVYHAHNLHSQSRTSGAIAATNMHISLMPAHRHCQTLTSHPRRPEKQTAMFNMWTASV
jgi:hypothetical protein